MNNIALSDRNLVITHKTLRRAIGVAGMLMPFMLGLGAALLCGTGIQSSVSAYYHTCMRDSFVGLLCVIGVFLFSYRGYRNSEDNFVSNLGGFFALGVAFFPTTPLTGATPLSKTLGTLHLGFAALFFGTLIYFSMVLFVKTADGRTPTQLKQRRNKVYRGCGLAMSVALGLIVLLHVVPKAWTDAAAVYKPVFWLESVAIIAFGIAWLTKGKVPVVQAMLKVQKEQIKALPNAVKNQFTRETNRRKVHQK